MTHASSRRSTDHVVLRGQGFACLHCGQSYEPGLPAPMDVFVAASKAFTNSHSRCRPPVRPVCTFCRAEDHDWEGHVVATVRRPEDWPDCGDTGLSSTAIWRHMMGQPPDHRRGPRPPLDRADFGRCYRLLSAPWAALWRGRIGEMARYPEWPGLVAQWDELEALYLEERQHGAGKAPRLYAVMTEILYGPSAGGGR